MIMLISNRKSRIREIQFPTNIVVIVIVIVIYMLRNRKSRIREIQFHENNHENKKYGHG